MSPPETLSRDAAFEKMHRLIWKLVRRFAWADPRIGPAGAEDLFQEAALGFLERFDWFDKTHFSKYTWYVVQHAAARLRRFHRPADVLIYDPVCDEERTHVEAIENADTVGRALSSVCADDMPVIERVFGLDNAEPESQSDIARRTGLSRERISQRYKRSLSRMRVCVGA